MIAFSLKTPITVGTETYTELKFRPLRFGDAEALFDAKNEMHAMRILLCRMASVPDAVIAELDLQDVSDILAEIGSELKIPAI